MKKDKSVLWIDCFLFNLGAKIIKDVIKKIEENNLDLSKLENNYLENVKQLFLLL